MVASFRSQNFPDAVVTPSQGPVRIVNPASNHCPATGSLHRLSISNNAMDRASSWLPSAKLTFACSATTSSPDSFVYVAIFPLEHFGNLKGDTLGKRSLGLVERRTADANEERLVMAQNCGDT
jgi:hypothetical protein